MGIPGSKGINLSLGLFGLMALCEQERVQGNGNVQGKGKCRREWGVCKRTWSMEWRECVGEWGVYKGRACVKETNDQREVTVHKEQVWKLQKA